jgi:hypothetical protein
MGAHSEMDAGRKKIRYPVHRIPYYLSGKGQLLMPLVCGVTSEPDGGLCASVVDGLLLTIGQDNGELT